MVTLIQKHGPYDFPEYLAIILIFLNSEQCYILELPIAVHIEETYMYKSSTCISYLNADIIERSSSFSASNLVQKARY